MPSAVGKPEIVEDLTIDKVATTSIFAKEFFFLWFMVAFGGRIMKELIGHLLRNDSNINLAIIYDLVLAIARKCFTRVKGIFINEKRQSRRDSKEIPSSHFDHSRFGSIG